MKGIITRWLLCIFVFLVAGCEYEEVKKETGYKGKAQLNPWLAAERFAERKGYKVVSSGKWLKPASDHNICFVPVGVMNNAGVVSIMKEWVINGGHLVLLVEYSESEWNDWTEFRGAVPELQPPLIDFLEEAGITLRRHGPSKNSEKEVTFEGKTYQVDMDSGAQVSTGGGTSRDFASVDYNDGSITVIADSRIFRNRNIGEKDHAALLSALMDFSAEDGSVVFLRGAGISLWRMLGRDLWPVIVGLTVALIVWLWKSFTRFGPIESATIASPLRGYDHHLEALGDFQWRLDKGSALLSPIRERIVESGQRAAASVGRRDEDFFQFLADRSGLPRERVRRVLTEVAPADGSLMTRTASDLQKLLAALRS